jgi:hypothetical protein
MWRVGISPEEDTMAKKKAAKKAEKPAETADEARARKEAYLKSQEK